MKSHFAVEMRRTMRRTMRSFICLLLASSAATDPAYLTIPPHLRGWAKEHLSPPVLRRILANHTAMTTCLQRSADGKSCAQHATFRMSGSENLRKMHNEIVQSPVWLDYNVSKGLPDGAAIVDVVRRAAAIPSHSSARVERADQPQR